ncbi:MAG: TetR/AcrR family transcriptional regulator [Clostridiaceae bacterium]|jgi:AcrR family transcriptional regulator|nr:TetR/AcrR family transcriptional regulator [Clostridiaceae bacterium]
MYRIGNDKRKRDSAKLICDGLNTLMQKKPYSMLTVTEIAECAGVGRATFYRLFDDKSDVILYQTEGISLALLEHFSSEKTTGIDDLLNALFDIWLNQKALFFALMESNLYEWFQTQVVSTIETKFSFIKEVAQLDTRSWKYFINVRVSMLFAALRVAITQFPDDTPASVITTLNYLFSNQQNILKK